MGLLRQERIRLADNRVLALALKRPDEDAQMQTAASHVVTACIRCNTAHQFLGSEDDARSSGYYVCKYCAKDPVKAKLITPILYEMDKLRESIADNAGSEVRNMQSWLTRALNNYNSMREFSDTQIASMLMGYDSYHTSHIFWTFHAKSFVIYQRKHFEENSVAPDITVDDTFFVVPEDGDADDDDREKETQMLFVRKDKKGDKKILTALQHEHYLIRGSGLKDLSPYDYVAMIKVEKRPKEKEGEDGISVTRQRNAAFKFEEDDTDWYKTHHQVLHSKFVILHCDALQRSFDVWSTSIRPEFRRWCCRYDTEHENPNAVCFGLMRIAVHDNMMVRRRYHLR